MRKFNAVLSAVILVLFIIHGLLGAMALSGIGHVNFRWVAWLMVGFIAVHTFIGTVLTVQTLINIKKTGAPYFKENSLFWARRISGFAIMLFIFLHISAFSYTTYGVYRLKYFGMAKLAAQLLLLLSIAVHVISNIKPVLIAFGIKKIKPRAGDILLFLSVMLLFMAAAFIIYFIRWNSL